jgi:hypothetical protein
MSSASGASLDLVYVSDLFERFDSICGSCHGPSVDPPGLGGFQIRSANAFSTAMTADVLEHIKSDGPTGDPADDPMPPLSSPNGSPFSKRPPTDPVYEFAELVTQWLAVGSPQSFSPSGGASPDGGADAGATPSAYQLSTYVGDTMTNLGACIPSAGLVAAEQEKSQQLDAMFAGLVKATPGPGVTPAQIIGLPEHIGDTDLVSLDTATLARYGVVAFQPTYPLWSDSAGKLRFVRVPRGTSITFNKATQEFTIPPNTRFYKTFLKRIADTDGSFRYRKIETRLIVSRPDQIAPDGTATVTALFGTYQWNDDETDATLIETPLRSGLPFADTVLQYTTDEQLAADILATKPLLPLEALLEGGAARHYAIPSSDRCVECHMGSNSASFILGFRPVQIKRRPAGQGGIIDEPNQGPPGADELTQLQRLIDYGIISGVDSPDDILPLEQSEGSRQPRNGYELTAQGYMVGNCSHCHNPRGYPSVTNPVLVNVLNFLPGANGGVFQFPLERYSPRIGRGPGGGEPIPYITPSLMDQPSGEWNSTTVNSFDDDWNIDIVSPLASMPGNAIGYALYAPWRSLVYRNVDTPFAYEDNLALFPHMPMNTPGYDCRAKQIMGDWMVSIPSVRKNPEKPEFAVATAPFKFVGGTTVDDNAQPYVEASPGTPQYDGAVAAAQARLDMLHTGVNPGLSSDFVYSEYSYCPDTSDILDPQVTLDPVCHPVPTTDDSSPLTSVAPDHAHWVNTDLSQAPDPPGTFSVRRPDWPEVVAQQTFSAPVATCGETLAAATAAQDDVKTNVALLQSVNLTEDQAFRTYATTQVPFGLWEQNPGCNFSSIPTAGSFTWVSRPMWMGHVNAAPSAPVYMASPGQAVFQMICINCHGPDGAADGRLAVNLATMTGGNAIVANFRDGLFGPLSSPGLHRQEAFATSRLPEGLGQNWTNASVDDRAARYLAWMALGGTEVQIPLSILTIVGDTRVLGVKRTLPQGAISANMLSAAKAICSGILTGPLGANPQFDWKNGWFDVPPGLDSLPNFPLLIADNGDAELWMRLCSFNNPAPVRVVYPWGQTPPYASSGLMSSTALVDPAQYPQGCGLGTSGPYLVGDGGAPLTPPVPLTSSNLFPWCISPPDPNDASLFGSKLDAANSFVQQSNLPLCPVTVSKCGPCCWDSNRIDEWATRGAINAGLAVYTYVDGLVKNLSAGKGPQPTYDQCSALQ